MALLHRRLGPGLLEMRKAIDPLPKSSLDMVMLQHWDDLETWQQDNEYIHHHYRPKSGAHWKSIASLGYLHNQTVNVYSHLFGALAFFAIAFSLFSDFTAQYAPEDRLLLAFFFLGAIVCFGSSAYFHLVGNHSHRIYNVWLTMDFFGIICLITGTAFPLAFYTYPCYKKTLRVCWALVRFHIHGQLG